MNLPEMNWLEMLVGAALSLALQLLVDQVVLKGKVRKAAMDEIKYITIGKWRIGDGSVVKGD